MRRPLFSLAMALVWTAGIGLLGRHITDIPPWAVFLGVAVFSMPAVLGSLYLVTIHKIQSLAGFASKGWLYRVFGGRMLATLFWVPWSLLGTFLLLLQFHGDSRTEWIALFAVVPVFFGLQWWLSRAMQAELKPYRQIALPLVWARRITPWIAVLVYTLIFAFSGEMAPVNSLADAIRLKQQALALPAGSALVHEVAHWVAYYEGARWFVASQIGAQGSWWALLVTAVGSWVIFFHASSMLSGVFVPAREYRRLLAPLSDADEPPRPEVGHVVLTSAIATVVVFFVALPAFAALEWRARQHHPEFAKVRASLDQLVVRIDDELYRATLLPELSELHWRMSEHLAALESGLEPSLHTAFDQLEANVDPFLDWYYQIDAEYLRTLNLLTGELETFVGKRLQAYLERGDPFGEFERQRDAVLAAKEDLQTRFDAEQAALLASHRLTPSDDQPRIVLHELALDRLPQFSVVETIPMGARIASGGGVGLVTGTIAAKLTEKISAKGLMKLAAQPLLKGAVSRSVLAGGAALSGAAIGSIIPVAGTAAGAAVGFGAGIVAGLGLDYGLLKLDETLNRDEFRQELIDSIREEREKVLPS